MFTHEEYLEHALKDCTISQFIQKLGEVYLKLIAQDKTKTMIEFYKAIGVYKILDDAATKIANLEPKSEKV